MASEIRAKMIELVVKLRRAKLAYQAKDSAMIDKTCPEYKAWLKASDEVCDFIATPECIDEIKKNGIVTAKEIEAAL